MSVSTRQRVNQYVADICRFTSQLGSVSKRDSAETRSAAVEKARAVYEELLTRKETLPIPREEIPMVEAMLERIKAQLKFLSRD
jgi:hypothetical protein